MTPFIKVLILSITMLIIMSGCEQATTDDDTSSQADETNSTFYKYSSSFTKDISSEKIQKMLLHQNTLFILSKDIYIMNTVDKSVTSIPMNRAYDMDLRDNKLYIADRDPYALKIYDITDPSNPISESNLTLNYDITSLRFNQVTYAGGSVIEENETINLSGRENEIKNDNIQVNANKANSNVTFLWYDSILFEVDTSDTANPILNSRSLTLAEHSSQISTPVKVLFTDDKIYFPCTNEYYLSKIRESYENAKCSFDPFETNSTIIFPTHNRVNLASDNQAGIYNGSFGSSEVIKNYQSILSDSKFSVISPVSAITYGSDKIFVAQSSTDNGFRGIEVYTTEQRFQTEYIFLYSYEVITTKYTKRLAWPTDETITALIEVNGILYTGSKNGTLTIYAYVNSAESTEELIDNTTSTSDITQDEILASYGLSTDNPILHKPIINLDYEENATLNSQTTLDASKSSDPNNDALTFSWSLASPSGSSTSLSSINTANVSFTPDQHGFYNVILTLTDQNYTVERNVTITVANSIAVAGTDASLSTNDIVTIHTNANPSQTVTTTVANSTAGMNVNVSSSSTDPTKATLDLSQNDQNGSVTITSKICSDQDCAETNTTFNVGTVSAGTNNTAPTADAGSDQNVSTGATVTLNGGLSTDTDNDSLSYIWSFVSKPTESNATLNNTAIAAPTFVPDKGGSYILSLIVSDSEDNSTADLVTITANTTPVANAGTDQNVSVGATITLEGNVSSDDDNDTLSYTWSFASKPAESNATLSDTNTSAPSFSADSNGTYVVTLSVSDGSDSDEDNVTINVTSSVSSDAVTAILTYSVQSATVDSVSMATRVATDANYTYMGVRDGVTALLSTDSNVSTVDTFSTEIVDALAVNGSHLYITADDNWGNNYLYDVNISDPAAMTQISKITVGSLFSDIVASGNYLYAATGEGLEIFNLSDPTQPVSEGNYTSGDMVFGSSAVAVSGSYAFIATDLGMDVVDITTPSSPTLNNSYDASIVNSWFGVNDIFIHGNYALVAKDADGLDIVNITDPTSPSKVTTIDANVSVGAVRVDGNFTYFAYTSDTAAGVLIYDISDPANPQPAGTVDLGDTSANDIGVSNDFLYAAENNGTFGAFKLQYQ